ncbi:IS1/IS1595 family N-terminal zinc-binding domain-containing protein [Pseudoduganella chitinolytica]|uniref:IS1/IS1595 family N-terminal zinc-binding domain-containing protein n=1 Tax=Pseudoduganella chitinolytica TaxID=34070 RepID=UPI003FCDBD43
MRHCPHCEGDRLYRHGVYRGLQRYRCRQCGASFTTTGAQRLSLRAQPGAAACQPRKRAMASSFDLASISIHGARA